MIPLTPVRIRARPALFYPPWCQFFCYASNNQISNFSFFFFSFSTFRGFVSDGILIDEFSLLFNNLSFSLPGLTHFAKLIPHYPPRTFYIIKTLIFLRKRKYVLLRRVLHTYYFSQYIISHIVIYSPAHPGSLTISLVVIISFCRDPIWSFS